MKQRTIQLATVSITILSTITTVIFQATISYQIGHPKRKNQVYWDVACVEDCLIISYKSVYVCYYVQGSY